MKVRSYRDLLIWRKGIELSKEVYGIIKQFPKDERYALSDQMKRSAVSVPSNIAEGQARQHTGEFKQFLYISLGSLAELDTQLTIASELEFVKDKESGIIYNKITEMQKMITSLIAKLNK